MADYDDDVRGATDADDPFALAGPRRSNFTPAPADSGSLEAAAKIFNDDAIAAALAADLARVLAGPAPDRSSVDEPKPVQAKVPAEPFDQQVAVDDPSINPSVLYESVLYESALDELVVDEPAISAPEPAAHAKLVAPPAPPEWAVPLFGQPTPVEPIAQPAPIEEAPMDEDDEQETLPAYLGAPPPTVPPADVPPPPGYDPPSSPFAPYTRVSEPELSRGDSDAAPVVEPDRVSLQDEDDARISATLSAIEKLQAQLELRDRETRERELQESPYSSPDSVTTNILSTETPTAEFPVPPIQQPVRLFGIEPPADSPFATLPPPTDRPFSTLPPPSEPSVAIRSPFAPPDFPLEPRFLGTADDPVFIEPPAFSQPPALMEPPAWEIPDFDQSAFSPAVQASPPDAGSFEIPSVGESVIKPPLAPRAFDDLLIGGGDSSPRPPDTVWRADDPGQAAAPPIDSRPEGKTSFWKRGRAR